LWPIYAQRPRTQVRLRKGIGMEASPIDFYLQNLLLPYIREVNLGTKVIEEGELVRLGRRLENYRT
jgi:hypothetical protein